jgi:hypothetical protein
MASYRVSADVVNAEREAVEDTLESNMGTRVTHAFDKWTTGASHDETGAKASLASVLASAALG